MSTLVGSYQIPWLFSYQNSFFVWYDNVRRGLSIMRMRKLKWAVEYLKEAQILVQDPSQYKGRWKEFLSREGVFFEVGLGKGNNLLKMTQIFQNKEFLVLEKTSQQLGLLLKN